MKKIIIGLILFVGSPALAVVACRPYTSSTTCSSGATNSFDWSMVCNGRTIRGYAYCSNYGGNSTAIGHTSTSNHGQGTSFGFCWCGTYSPHVSKRVYAHTYDRWENCITNCPTRCHTLGTSNSTFRTAILTTAL